MKQRKVYISGAMTGIDRKTFEKRFTTAENIFSEAGWKVYNPCNYIFARWEWLYKLLGYRTVLLLDLILMTRCTHIYVIPQYSRKSKGVRVEVAWAAACGLETITDINDIETTENTNNGHFEGHITEE